MTSRAQHQPGGTGTAHQSEARVKLDRAIVDNPLFAVVTFDGLGWIEPFSGSVIPTPFGRVAEARRYYTEHDDWLHQRARPMRVLQSLRWQHWLREHFDHDQRLQIFNAQDQWLNPHTGSWSATRVRLGGKLTEDSYAAMAEELLRSAPAGPQALLDIGELKRRAGAVASDEPRGDASSLSDSGRFKIPLSDNTETTATRGSGQHRITGLRRRSTTDIAIEDLRRMIADHRQATDTGSRELPPATVQSIQDLDRARNVQRKMLCKLPEVAGCEFAVHYRPRDSIGGDFYEVATLRDGRVLLLIGDVTGYGMQAALVTSSILKSLRFITRVETDLGEILAQLNDNAREDLVDDQHVDVWAAILDPQTGAIEAVSAGHHPALVAHPSAEPVIRRLGRPGVAIGAVTSPALRRQLVPVHDRLQPGEILVHYTAGVSAMQHPHDGEFGELRTMSALLYHLAAADPQQVIDGIAQTACSFVGHEPEDDITLLALRYRADGGPAE